MDEKTKRDILAYNVIGLTYEQISSITGEAIENIKDVVYERFPELREKEKTMTTPYRK